MPCLDAGRGELGVPRLGVPRIPSFFSKPRGRLLPAPSHPPPLPQGTSLGFFAKPPGHLGQRAPRCEILRFGAWSADLGQVLGWGWWRVAFPGEKTLLGVGPGVRHVQTCCWGSAHLILEAAWVGGWKWSHIFDQSHLGTKSASGRPRRSDFAGVRRGRAPRRADGGRGGGRTPRPCAAEHTRSLFGAQLYLFSPPTFLLRALGDSLSPTLPRRLRWPSCNS